MYLQINYDKKTYFSASSVKFCPFAIKHVQQACGKFINSVEQEELMHITRPVRVVSPGQFAGTTQFTNERNTSEGHAGCADKPSMIREPLASCKAENEYGNLGFSSSMIVSKSSPYHALIKQK